MFDSKVNDLALAMHSCFPAADPPYHRYFFAVRFVLLFLEADFLEVVFLVAAFLGADFLVADFLLPAFLGAAFLVALFLAVDDLLLFLGAAFFAAFLGAAFLAAFLGALFLDAAFLGALAPSFLASERPIAIACLRLVTFLPEPDFNVPLFISRMFSATLSLLFFEYFAME